MRHSVYKLQMWPEVFTVRQELTIFKACLGFFASDIALKMRNIIFHLFRVINHPKNLGTSVQFRRSWFELTFLNV